MLRPAYMILCAMLWLSCQKSDIKFPPGKYSRCEVERMEGPAPVNIRMSGGMIKEYNESGLVSALYTRVYTNMSGNVDSMKYHLTYSGNIVHVKAYYQMYQLDFTHEGGFSGEARVPEGEPRSREFDIILDPKTGNALSAADMSFNYKNGRLASFVYEGSSVIYPFVYDSRGNILREPGGAKFEYDYRRTAKKQQYFSAGHHELYTLVELLGWLPPAAVNLRTKYIYVLEGEPEYVFSSFEITDHTIAKDGTLTEYKVSGNRVRNFWKCVDIKPNGIRNK